MLIRTLIRSFFVALVMVLAWHLSGCTCTQVGCSDELSVSGGLAQPIDEQALLMIEVCRNDACSSGELDTGQPGQNVDGLSVVLEGDTIARFGLSQTPGLSDWRLLVILEPGGEAGDFEDGDIVTVRVVNTTTGNVLLDAGGGVDFDEFTPNDGCGPTCDVGSIDLANG